jgi:hypothetical protein
MMIFAYYYLNPELFSDLMYFFLLFSNDLESKRNRIANADFSLSECNQRGCLQSAKITKGDTLT